MNSAQLTITNVTDADIEAVVTKEIDKYNKYTRKKQYKVCAIVNCHQRIG